MRGNFHRDLICSAADAPWFYFHNRRNILKRRFKYFHRRAIRARLNQVHRLIYQAGGCAFFANPENPQDIAGAMKQLAESPGGRAEMGMRAFARSRLFSTKEFRTALLKTVLL